MKFSFKHSHIVGVVSILFLSINLNSCSQNDDDSSEINLPPSSDRGALVSYQQTGSLTANEIASNGANIGDVSAFTTNSIHIYRIVYNSLYNGASVQVSGLVMIPQNTSTALQLIQHHHGTIIPFDESEEEVPSNYTSGYTDSNAETSFIGAVMASNGYVVSLPDYVGYGETSNLEHPYTVHHELAEVSVDMIRATKNLLNELSIGFTNEVFITGWSEGGGAGLATHKYSQLNYPDEYLVKASSLLAGPYDYFTFVKDIIANRDLNDEELSIYSWGIYATNAFYSELNQQTNTIWNYIVSNQLDAIDVPSLKPSEIFQTEFMDGIENEIDNAWITALKDNTLLEDWIPQGYLFFHSGTEDLIVPHYNSINVNAQFLFVGANSTLYEYEGGDHYTPLYNYVTTTLNDFSSL